MQKAKGFAFTIVLAMMVVNFILPRPVVPSLPHQSWRWLTPVPVEVMRGDETDAGWFIQGLILILAAMALEGLNQLARENLAPMIQDYFDREFVGDNVGGGGSGGGRELESNF